VKPAHAPLALLAVLLAAAALAGLFVGTSPLAPGKVLAGLAGAGDEAARIIVQDIRLPRTLAAIATGLALGMAGAAMQGLLRNPLAEPGVLGVSATASLAATLTIFFGLAAAAPWSTPLAAVAGALAATGFLALVAARVGSVVALILVGVGVSSLAGALMSVALNFAPHPFALADLVSWMLGSVANRSMPDLALVTPLMAAGGVLLWASRRALAALTLGEESAAAVGVDLVRARLLVVCGTGLMVGASVALAGAVGFVGLVAAHLVRPWFGHDPSRTLLPAGILGGLMVVSADLAVRLAPVSGELKLGVVAALFGAPLFIWIAARRGQAHG
jgi:iron complex transport system permease protein